MIRLLAVLIVLFLVPAPMAAAATQQVHMSGYAYGPATLTIKVGDTVTWTNHDTAPHDAVTTAGPAQFRSAMLSTGQSWSFTFTVPGTYSYYCSVHPDMRAQIVVQPAAQAPPPQQQQPQQQTQRRQPVASAPRTPTTTSAQAQPPTVVEAEPAEQPPVATATAAAQPPAQPGIDPLLLVAGLVAGVATLCLLLIGSRSSAS